MISVSVSVDVSNLADGVRFYANVFGFSKLAELAPGVVVLRCSALAQPKFACLRKLRVQYLLTTQEKRHWTPVHLDFHVDDVKVALAKALAAGATQEQFFENHGHGSVIMCSDPFGHGFCLIGTRR